jgi:hypothetical protein
MNIKKECKKLWLKTYKKTLFYNCTMPGGMDGKMTLNPSAIAKKADEVVEEFKKRFKK